MLYFAARLCLTAQVLCCQSQRYKALHDGIACRMLMDEKILPPPYIPKENADERARLIFEECRWPDGKPSCPGCGSQSPIYKQTRQGVDGYYRCPLLHVDACGITKPLIFTVRTATVLERSHIPLGKWLHCLEWYCQIDTRSEIPSANAISQLLGINRKTVPLLLEHLYAIRQETKSNNQDNAFLRRLMGSFAKKK